MCNQLHPNSQPIPKRGFAYKVFMVKRKPYGTIYRPVFKLGQFEFIGNRYVKWNHRIFRGDGFCAFENRASAYAFKTNYNEFETATWVVKKIQYRGGRGKHPEPAGLNNKIVMIFEEFRLA